MISSTQFRCEEEIREMMSLPKDAQHDKNIYAKLDHFIKGIAALKYLIKQGQNTTAMQLSTLSANIANLNLRTSSVENLLNCSRVTDSDDLYVSLDEVSHLSGYGRKRCRQLMNDAIDRGDIRIDQKGFINKAGKETQSRPRYHLGDCKRFWTPARIKKTAGKKDVA